MSQADLNIENISRSLFRAEVNASLQALASASSGTTEPTTTYPFQVWADTTSGLFKQRTAANDGWITLFTLSLGALAQLGGMTLTGELNTKRSAVVATATTTPLWAAGTGNIQDWTGTPTITNFPAAPQAGSSRTVYPTAGTIITHAGNISVQGNANYTVAAGDKVYIEALTTSTFKVFIEPKSGNVKLATTAETAARTDAVKAVTPASLQGLLVLGTVIATTSGSSHDFTGIPSWAKKVTINFSGVSTTGTNNIFIQIGDSGGIEVSGYLGAAWSTSAATGVNDATAFPITASVAAVTIIHGSASITLLDSATNTWSSYGNIAFSNSASLQVSAGSKSLSATLDRVRIIVGGGDTFDAGKINILYE